MTQRNDEEIPQATRNAVTSYLDQWYQGDAHAFEQLLMMTYRDLRKAAAGVLRGEQRQHSLQPTQVINEIYLRLQAHPQMRFENRAQFFGFAGRLMRQFLVDYNRARHAQKRGGHEQPVALDDVSNLLKASSLEMDSVLAVDHALAKLEAVDPRQAQVVELRFFGGLNMIEIAEALNISESTALREWRTARIFLARILSDGRSAGN